MKALNLAMAGLLTAVGGDDRVGVFHDLRGGGGEVLVSWSDTGSPAPRLSIVRAQPDGPGASLDVELVGAADGWLQDFVLHLDPSERPSAAVRKLGLRGESRLTRFASAFEAGAQLMPHVERALFWSESASANSRAFLVLVGTGRAGEPSIGSFAVLGSDPITLRIQCGLALTADICSDLSGLPTPASDPVRTIHVASRAYVSETQAESIYLRLRGEYMPLQSRLEGVELGDWRHIDLDRRLAVLRAVPREVVEATGVDMRSAFASLLADWDHSVPRPRQDPLLMILKRTQ